MNDGTPRWLGHRDNDSAGCEVIGPATAVDRVALVLAATDTTAEAAGAEMGDFLDAFAPRSRAWLGDIFAGYSGSRELDDEERFGDLTVHVQTITAADGALVVVTVDHD